MPAYDLGPQEQYRAAVTAVLEAFERDPDLDLAAKITEVFAAQRTTLSDGFLQELVAAIRKGEVSPGHGVPEIPEELNGLGCAHCGSVLTPLITAVDIIDQGEPGVDLTFVAIPTVQLVCATSGCLGRQGEPIADALQRVSRGGEA